MASIKAQASINLAVIPGMAFIAALFVRCANRPKLRGSFTLAAMLNKPCKTLSGKKKEGQYALGKVSLTLSTTFSLCRPTSNRYQGVPFKPSRFVTIDLFPHTDHSELMIEFVRVEDPDVDMSS